MSAPPVIDQREKNVESRKPDAVQGNPLWWLLGLAGMAVVSRAIIQWGVAMPVCGSRSLTGIPCPLCGGTRAMKSIAELDFLTAIQLNPLVVLAGALIAIWALLGISDRLFGTRRVDRLGRRWRRFPVVFVAFGLVLLNWLYLILFQR